MTLGAGQREAAPAKTHGVRSPGAGPGSCVWVPVESMTSQIWELPGQPGACRLCPTAVPR